MMTRLAGHDWLGVHFEPSSPGRAGHLMTVQVAVPMGRAAVGPRADLVLRPPGAVNTDTVYILDAMAYAPVVDAVRTVLEDRKWIKVVHDFKVRHPVGWKQAANEEKLLAKPS